VGFKAKELLHMSISDDPRGFRRGQPGNSQYPSSDGRGEEQKRQPARPDSRNGARPASPRQEDPFPAFKDENDGPAFAERPAPQAQRQPSFSAYRPEAYAAGSADKGGGRPAPRPEWQSESFPGEPQQQQRPAPEKRAAPRPPETFRPQPAPERPRTVQDPYHNVAGDPYDAGRREFDNGWQDDSYTEQSAGQFAASNNYYQHQEDPNPVEVQSVHNRFFAAEPEPERAPKPAPAPQQARYRDDYASHDYGEEDRPPVRGPKPAPANARNAGYDDGGDYRWDNFEQAPAPEAARPFQPPAKIAPPDMGGHEDLDADYFADEEEFDGEEDYAEPKRGGSKKLMAAVLVGAVVTGGGLAYMYKSQVGGNVADSGEPPVLAADVRPVKEQPTEPGGREFRNGSKLIYERLVDNGAPPAGDSPRGAARDEAPADNGAAGGVLTTGTSGTLEERIQNALRDAKRQDDTGAAPITTANVVNPDAPRAVKTEVFRPDGSVEPTRTAEVSRGVQRRQAPAEAEVVPSAAFASAGGSARLAAAPREAAPAPQARQPARSAELTPANTQPSAATAAISTGGEPGMFVQIAARNDEAAAIAAFADLQQKYAGVLGSHSPSVRKVDLGEKGVWYRLLVGPMPSKPEADKLCEELKSAGMKGCFSRKE
jgi:hypothetical protein